MHLTKSEQQIMQIFWQADHAMAQTEVVATCVDRKWKERSIFSMLNSLMEKGLLREVGFVRSGKTYARTFEPAMSQAEYLAQVQASKQTMENLDSSIERYNHALECCYTDNLDVAVLQLKKVLSVNPRYLRARQLLALLYIENKQYKRADKELQRCLLLDVNNTTTLRYRKEVLSKLQPEGASQAGAQNAMHKANVGEVSRR